MTPMEKRKTARKIAVWTIVLNALAIAITIFAFPLVLLLVLVLDWLQIPEGSAASAASIIGAIILYFALLGATATLDILYVVKSRGPRPLKAFAIISVVCIVLCALDFSFVLARSRI